MKKKTLIFASKYEDKIYPEHIVGELETEYERLEYGDVFEGKYEIWEYPSGKIFKIEPDRKIDDKDYYSVPYTTKETLWHPKLTLVKTDKNKVSDAYKTLSKE